MKLDYFRLHRNPGLEIQWSLGDEFPHTTVKFVTSRNTMLMLSLVQHLKKKKKKERAVTKVNQLVLIVKFFIYQYYFICRFDEGKHKVWKPCTTYLLDQDYNSGCLFKTEGPTLAISVRNSNGSEELFSKKLKSDFYSKYEKSQLLWQFQYPP